MSDDFSSAEIVAYLQTPHYAKLVRQAKEERRLELAQLAKRKAAAVAAGEARRARAVESRRAASAIKSAANAIAASEATATQQRELERAMLDDLRSELVDAVVDASSSQQQERSRIDAIDLERLCLKLQLDQIQQLLSLKPKQLISNIVDSIAQLKLAAADEAAAAAAKLADGSDAASGRARWSDDELAALSKGMAKFPGGTPNRWECIRDKFLPERSTKDIIAKCREIDVLNSAAILKEREQLRSDFEQSQAKKNATATTSAVAAAASTTTTTAPAPAPAASTSDWSNAEQAKLEEALRLFPGAATDKARWEQIATHVGRSRRDVVERVKQCAAAATAIGASNVTN
jgi:hypothetical protein